MRWAALLPTAEDAATRDGQSCYLGDDVFSDNGNFSGDDVFSGEHLIRLTVGLEKDGG
jgi:hypothetical protein